MDAARKKEAQTARAEIADGSLRGATLLERVLSVAPVDREEWVGELLEIDSCPPDAPDLPRGSVPYLPCGVDEILSMLSDLSLGPTDEFVDLGSGLGRVAILVHLLTGARAHGIEIQEHLVRAARASCADLNLNGVTFDHANAVDADLRGSAFFLYAPFNGAMLATVLGRLEELSRTRPMVIGAVGLELRGLDWIRARASSNPLVALGESYREPSKMAVTQM